MQFGRIHTSSLFNIEKILNRPITKFYSGNDVDVIVAGSIIIEVIKTVLNFFFFTIRFYKYKKAFFLSISP